MRDAVKRQKNTIKKFLNNRHSTHRINKTVNIID